MKIVIIEDHALLADLLATVCRRDFGFEVVATEERGVPGLAAVRQTKPDILLLDISLPDMDGLDIAEIVLDELPATRVVALTSLHDPVTFKRIRALGLHGFVDKRGQNVRLLQETIRLVSEGNTFYSPVMAEVLGSLRHDPQTFQGVLSPHEQRVLSLIGESKTDEEIAVQMNLQISTAQSRRRDIMRKIGIHSTPKLIRYAIANGFTRTEHFPRQPPDAF